MRATLTAATTSCPFLYTGRSVRQTARSQPSRCNRSWQTSRNLGSSRSVPVSGSTTTETSQETPLSMCLARWSGCSVAISLAIYSGISGAAISPSATELALAGRVPSGSEPVTRLSPAMGSPSQAKLKACYPTRGGVKQGVRGSQGASALPGPRSPLTAVTSRTPARRWGR